MINYRDIEPIFGMIISGKMATLHELSSVYSLNDVYVMYDIIYTDNYNNELMQYNIKKANKS
jgi:hypothetical protein